MGSCCSCLDRDSVPHNHPTKFKVTNVDDEGVELGSGVMELTQSELVLHLHQREAVRWPYLCLRRYGYDSNLFSFESGRRCQTGQGIFAFKCSRAEEIFNLLQDLMQCNSINVMEEPVIITRNSHPPELDLPRGPSQPTGYTVSSLSNGCLGCPGEGTRFSTPRRPSTSSLRHPTLGEESTHTLIGADEQSHTYVNTPTGEEDHRRSRHCLQPLPEGRAPFLQTRVSDQRDPQVFLQPGQVKFVLGPTPARRQAMKCQSLCPNMHDPPHHNNNEGPSECPAQPKCTYENVSGSLQQAAGWRLSPEEPGWSGLAHRRAALLHYENLPPLPPVWESQAQQLGLEAGDDGDSRDGLTPSSNGFPDGEEEETPLQKQDTHFILQTLEDKFKSVGFQKIEDKKRKKTPFVEKQRCTPDVEISKDLKEKEHDGNLQVSGWTPAHIRKQLVIGVNEVTRALERNELLLVLVCKSVKPAIMTSHMIQLSISRTVPACQVPQLSQRIAPVIGLKCVLALGFRKNTMDFAEEVRAIIPRVPSLHVPWLQDRTQDPKDDLETELLKSQDKEILDTSFDDLTKLSKRKMAEGGQASAAILQPLKIKKLIPNPNKIRKPPKSKKSVSN